MYDDRSAGSKAWHRNRQQPIWPMRVILNRVLLALSWISIRTAADAQMLLKKQGFSPKLLITDKLR